MNSRERVLATINHQQPDRVPLDLGSTICSTITAKAYARLRAYLGIPVEPLPPIVRSLAAGIGGLQAGSCLKDPDGFILALVALPGKSS